MNYFELYDTCFLLFFGDNDFKIKMGLIFFDNF